MVRGQEGMCHNDNVEPDGGGSDEGRQSQVHFSHFGYTLTRSTGWIIKQI